MHPQHQRPDLAADEAATFDPTRSDGAPRDFRPLGLAAPDPLDTLDVRLVASAPPIAAREATLLATLEELVLATRPTPRPRRHVPRAAVAGLVLAGTLGFSGAAAAGGYLPMSMTPWRQHPLADGTQCQLRFQATQQVEPARLAGRVPGQSKERTTVLAAQSFLDAFDVSTIDADAALRILRTGRAHEQAKVPPSEWAPSDQHEDEVVALINATFAQLAAALERQGLDPSVVSISTTYDCTEQG